MDASGACIGAVNAMKWANSARMSQSRSFMCGYCDRFLAQVWVIKAPNELLCARRYGKLGRKIQAQTLFVVAFEASHTQAQQRCIRLICVDFFSVAVQYFFPICLSNDDVRLNIIALSFVYDLCSWLPSWDDDDVAKFSAEQSERAHGWSVQKWDDGSVNGSAHSDKAILSWLNPPHRAIQPCCSHKINNDRAGVTWIWKA